MSKSIFHRAAWGNWLLFGFPIVFMMMSILVRELSRQASSDSPFFYIGISLMLVGWVLLVRSKWDQVKRGDVFTFGISKTHPEMKWLYRCSYIVMVSGWLMACFSGIR